MNKHNGTPLDRTIDKKEAEKMKPETALSGIEFHALASKGLIYNIRQNMGTNQPLDGVNAAAEQVEAAYRILYRAMSLLSRSHELALLESRKAEIQAT